jgi:hypothetical protein
MARSYNGRGRAWAERVTAYRPALGTSHTNDCKKPVRMKSEYRD